MRTRPLRTYDLPDLADHVIHFTGRQGPKIRVEDEILGLSDWSRLLRICADQRIKGFAPFGAVEPVVCLTESTRPAVSALIREGRYTAWGIGFAKDHVFRQGGGPALYVRGDEWALMADMPEPLRSRAVRFWPGANPDPGEQLCSDILRPSEWLHEREWRVPGQLTFEWNDIAFLVIDDIKWKAFGADWINSWAEGYGAAFMNIPTVVLDQGGNVILDERGLWDPAPPSSRR